MTAMRTELGVLAAVAVIAGLGLLASSGPPRPVRSDVVLNRTPPPPPASQLAWDMPFAAAAPVSDRRLPAHGTRPAPPEQAPSVPAAAGVWATPAEFAESD
jgi:hypothetical protein